MEPLPTSLASPAPARRQTGSFRWALVAAIVLGAAGVLFGVTGAFTAFDSREEAVARSVKLTNLGSGFVRGPKTPTAELRDLQAEMARKLAERIWELHGWQRLTWAANSVLSLLLLAGAILAVKRSERGRRLLRWTAWAHLPYEALAAVVSVLAAVKTGEVTGEYMVKMMSAAAGPKLPELASELGSGMAKASLAIGLAGGVGWRLALVAFWVWLAITLNRREVRETFRRPGLDGALTR